MWLVILFVIIGISARFFPHLPNFAPIAVVALFSGVYFKKKYGWLLPLGIYIISDLMIGLHQTIFFTWGTIVFIYFLGRALQTRKTTTNTAVFTLASSFIFFLITNFGVWLMGWYPPTLAGLTSCYINALPFFRVSLIANFSYGLVFFGAYEYFVKRTKLAHQAA
ncbi:MAG: hypothetical protein K9L69_03945 [Candidatus Omnitrophica bacterium]|nr:hypothetical protein [Candidatus Omnitrophota bacterium]MCF7895265.1 hypothetical protein [Candidatus Omnitrophota bacterium]